MLLNPALEVGKECRVSLEIGLKEVDSQVVIVKARPEVAKVKLNIPSRPVTEGAFFSVQISENARQRYGITQDDPIRLYLDGEQISESFQNFQCFPTTAGQHKIAISVNGKVFDATQRILGVGESPASLKHHKLYPNLILFDVPNGVHNNP